MNISILYGSQSGNAKGLARQAGEFFNKKGHTASVKDLADITVSMLKSYDNILLITSTWGNGGPPTNAAAIHKELQNSSEDLSNTSFAVFGIGSTKRARFCQAGIDFDNFLSNLKSKRLVDLVKADDYNSVFPEWLEKVNSSLA